MHADINQCGKADGADEPGDVGPGAGQRVERHELTARLTESSK